MYCRGILVALCLVVLLTNCSSDAVPEAEVELLSWKQNCDVIYQLPIGPILDEVWGAVEIRYEIKNVGEVDIDYYKIWFAVQYTSRPVRYGIAEGSNIPKGKLERNSIFLDFYPDSKVMDVDLSDYEVGIF